MNTFKTFLIETYKNVFNKSDKEKWIDQVWDVLQSSYAPIGGIKTPSFKSKEAALTSDTMWKLTVRDGKVKTVSVYKDDGTGRKSVLTGTDGTKEAKSELKKIIIDEFGRSYREVSDDFEKFLWKNFEPEMNKFKIPNTEIHKYLKPDEFRIPEKDDGYHYDRKIGGSWHTKIMVGTPGKNIVR
jgi:hypothetical protein